MNLDAGWLGKRLVLSVLAAYLVMSLAFGLIAFTPDPNEALVAHQAARESGGNATVVENAVEDYRESRNRDEPISERYVNYLVDTTRLQWGASFSRGRTVSAVVGSTLPVTARYVLFALVLSLLGGLGLGAYGALNHRSPTDRAVAVAVYGLFGLANFYLAAIALDVLGGLGFGLLFGWLSVLPTWLVGPAPGLRVALPGVVLATTLLAGQVRYARAASLEYLDQEFVKLLRSKGAGPLRVGRHVVRNSAIPLVSLFFSELLSVLVVEALVVERVFGLPGVASTLLSAVDQRDLPLVVGIAMTIAFVGIGANLLQDVAYRLLDPRVGD